MIGDEKAEPQAQHNSAAAINDNSLIHAPLLPP
jgi:hypothetical protein